MLQLMREGCAYTYPPLPTARYSFIQLSELEQRRVKQLAQGFNTAAQDSNPGYLSSRQSEALPLSHCALRFTEFSWNYLVICDICVPRSRRVRVQSILLSVDVGATFHKR